MDRRPHNALAVRLRFQRRRQSVVRRSAFNSRPAEWAASEAAAAVSGAGGVVTCGVVTCGVAAGGVAAGGVAGCIAAGIVVTAATFCGSDELGAAGSSVIRALASRARLERSAFFLASKTMLNTFFPEKPLPQNLTQYPQLGKVS